MGPDAVGGQEGDEQGTWSREGGHEQVFGQAAAMLVSLAAMFAAKFDTVALATLLDESLAIACSSSTSLNLCSPLVRKAILGFVVNGVFRHFSFAHVKPVCRQARGRGQEAICSGATGGSASGRGMTTRGGRYRHPRRPIAACVLESCRHCCHIGCGVAHGLSASDTVVGIEGGT